MGMYNEVILTCPHCGYANEHQSKAGDCSLKTRLLEEADPKDKVDALGGHQCDKCMEYFTVTLQVVAAIRKGKVDNGYTRRA